MPPKGSKMSPAHRAAIRRALNRPQVRQKRSESGKVAWSDPELLAQQRKRMEGQWKDPAYRQRRHAGMLKVAADPKECKRKSKRSKQNWARKSPEERAVWVKNLTTENRARAARGNRPADWDEKPIEWRIIGTELLSQENYMSNAELGRRLDASRILTCPYGEDWKSALSKSRPAITLVSNVRTWVNRPGKIPTEKKVVNPLGSKIAAQSSLF